ncbi:MAG: histidine--tRNA ligase [Patescibacteria group bacterium]|nr:MAG: histidine--tRNA ligase [Patescibacteria group bacterium]
MVEKTFIKPTILPGFMELLPRDQVIFNKMLDSIRESFELCGFLPLDTPVLEKADILLAKSGKEAEKQIYTFKKGDSEMALRFDFTVPLARYVSQRYNELSFPFKRYQIGKVFRGERPQKGRFREFYQCDVDIIDKDSLAPIYDAEIVATAYTTFERLNLGSFLIKINNRKLLTGYIEKLGLNKKTKEILREIDKVQKIGEEMVAKDFEKMGVNINQTEKILDFINSAGSVADVLKKLKSLNVANDTFDEGVKEIEDLVKNIGYMNIPKSCWTIDLSIARGLDYYTGTIFEIVLTEYPEFGSICGGGRYNNLAEYFSDKKLPGTGISIGLTRLFDLLKENNLLKYTDRQTLKVLVIPLGDYTNLAYDLVANLRKSNIQADVLYTGEGLKKKLSIASKSGVRFVAIIGEDEVKNKRITVKDMETGEQNSVPAGDIVSFVTKS